VEDYYVSNNKVFVKEVQTKTTTLENKPELHKILFKEFNERGAREASKLVSKKT